MRRLFKQGSVVAGRAWWVLGLSLLGGCIDAPAADKAGRGRGTWLDPIVLRRDNPALGGQVQVTGSAVKGRLGSDGTTLSTAKWEGAEGYLEVKELRADNSLYATYKTPLLPRETFDSPGTAKFGTRGITMVHGNKYAARAVGTGAGNSGQATDTTHYKLADDVLVVPLVVVNWIPRGQGDFMGTRVAGMFDFYPAVASYPVTFPNTWRAGYPKVVPSLTPTLFQADLTAANYKNGSTTLERYNPSYGGATPDDVFAGCGVQFQVIARVDVSEPVGFRPGERCNDQAENLPESSALTAAWNNSPIAQYISRVVQPLTVGYANYGCGYWNGMYHPSGVEIDVGRAPNILAHELGHHFGGPDVPNHQRDREHDRDPGNLLHASYSGTKLTPGQCSAARSKAADYSARYDEYSRVTGRTYTTTPPADIWAASGSAGGDGGFSPASGPIDLDGEVCCVRPGTSTPVFVSRLACVAQGGRLCPVGTPR